MKTYAIQTLLAATLVCAACAADTAASLPCAQNRAPLKQQPYLRLPMGSVQAKDWLKHQLVLQKDGLTGHAEELYEDIGKSVWVGGTSKRREYNWQRGPYYTKGLIALAYVLDDESLKKKAQPWIEYVLKSQREDGSFGPEPEKHYWWNNMIVLHYLRDYCEATGDERIPPFMEKYFRYQLKTLPEHRLGYWQRARGADNLEVVLWLYNRTGEKWLLELADLLMKQTNAWHEYYAGRNDRNKNDYPHHIVNAMQGLKAPPLMYLVNGEEAYRNAFWKGTNPDGWMVKRCGRIDGMVSGTEPLTDRSSTTGTELCAIVERILSNTVAIKILGDAYIGDQLERVAYNALPADLSPDIKGLRYYVLPNQPKSTNENLGFKHNGKDRNSICPSPHSGYACCRSNFHHGWPKFVHNMWMATADGGLAAAVYGPNTVTAKVAKGGVLVTIDQATDYPFKAEVKLTITSAEAVEFPLELRIPGWCEAPAIKVNDTPVEGVEPGTFHRIEREWKTGDTVTLNFPMEPQTSRWINDSIAVTRGPLVFSLLIEEEWKSTQAFLDGQFHTYEIRPKGAWNYALAFENADQPRIEVTVADVVPAQPFRAANAPVRMTLKAFKTDEGGWGTYREDFPARAVEPPPSPVKASERVENVTLIPYGSAQSRITYFPWKE